MKKVVYTLEVGDYSREIVALTRPLLENWVDKIGAELCVIRERAWPEYSPTYEKLQIYELGQILNADWNIYVDADALVHPDFFDPTDHVSKDTVLHNWRDMAGNRWKYDRFFRRDGRHIGSGNWFTIASDWCIDLWKQPDDISYADCVANIRPILFELQSEMFDVDDKGQRVLDESSETGFKMRPKAVVTAEHLVDDYILSRNIAKYGLKFTTLRDVLAKIGHQDSGYLWHEYVLTADDKVAAMRKKLREWGISVEVKS